MVKGQSQRPQRKPSQKITKNRHNETISVHVTLSDYVSGVIAAVLLGLGAILASDPQFRWPGAFTFVGGTLVVCLGVFVHVRHRTLGHARPAIGIMAGFVIGATGTV